MQVRAAGPSDLAAVTRMVAAGAAYHAELDALRYRACTARQLHPSVAPLLDDPPTLERGVVLVADRGGPLVGTALIKEIRSPRKVMRQADRILQIGWLWTEHAQRGCGVAQSLVADIEARARTAGISKIECDISGLNDASRALFGKNGYAAASICFSKTVPLDSPAEPCL